MTDTEVRNRILLVEDSRSLINLYQAALSPLDVELKIAETFSSAREQVANWAPDLVLLDLNLPDGTGMNLLKLSQGSDLQTQFIIITSNGSINSAVTAMREGAEDFLVKPFLPARLLETVRFALTDIATRRVESSALPLGRQAKQGLQANGFEGIVGKSNAMQRVFSKIQIAGPSETNVLITGKTGTGKELCAEALHKLSLRKRKPFVVLNCAAIPRDLMESELFGHMKGAFTGATATRDGAAHLADGGTLFLDEIGEMDLGLQSKLLRFIQNQTFNRVGSNKIEKVSVRFIAATNRDPLMEVLKGTFREDLYYRLNVVPIHLPDLKDRGDDVLILANKFVESFRTDENSEVSQFTNEAYKKMLAYSWPGNIRQLQNLVRNTLMFAKSNLIQASDIPDELMPEFVTVNSRGHELASSLNDDMDVQPIEVAAFGINGLEVHDDEMSLKIEPLHLVERKLIDMALEKFDGNVAKVASALDISASSVYRKKSMAR